MFFFLFCLIVLFVFSGRFAFITSQHATLFKAAAALFPSLFFCCCSSPVFNCVSFITFFFCFLLQPHCVWLRHIEVAAANTQKKKDTLTLLLSSLGLFIYFLHFFHYLFIHFFTSLWYRALLLWGILSFLFVLFTLLNSRLSTFVFVASCFTYFLFLSFFQSTSLMATSTSRHPLTLTLTLAKTHTRTQRKMEHVLHIFLSLPYMVLFAICVFFLSLSLWTCPKTLSNPFHWLMLWHEVFFLSHISDPFFFHFLWLPRRYWRWSMRS